MPAEAECGLIGCAALAQTAMGCHANLTSAAGALVRYVAEIEPDPAWRDTYARMQPVFDRVYRHSQDLYGSLDSLSASNPRETGAGADR